MLSNEQIDTVVAKINQKINLPVLGEKTEAVIFKMVVKKILKFLEEHLPEEWINLINNTSDGLTPQEVNAIVDKLVRYMNAQIDIPLLSEDEEAIIFETVVRLIIESMAKNKSLETVIAA